MSSDDEWSLSSVELEFSLLSSSGVSVVVVDWRKKLNFLENIFVNFLKNPDSSNLCWFNSWDRKLIETSFDFFGYTKDIVWPFSSEVFWKAMLNGLKKAENVHWIQSCQNVDQKTYDCLQLLLNTGNLKLKKTLSDSFLKRFNRSTVEIKLNQNPL